MSAWESLIEHYGSALWIPPFRKPVSFVKDTEVSKIRMFPTVRGTFCIQMIKPTADSENTPYHTFNKDELMAVGMACIRMAMGQVESDDGG